MKIRSKRARERDGLVGYRGKVKQDVGFFYAPYMPQLTLVEIIAKKREEIKTVAPELFHNSLSDYQ